MARPNKLQVAMGHTWLCGGVFGKANVIALRMRYGTNDVNVKHAVRRRSAEAELWRKALFRQGLNTLFDLGSPEARVPAVAPAFAGRRLDEVKAKQEVRRRSG